MYVRELLLETTCDISVTKPFLKMLTDLFNHQIIDYKLLTRSAIGLMKKKKFGVMVSGYYFRSSILNPAAIYALSKEYFGEKVFTPTLGWSSYLYGSLCNKNVKEYVGTDVIEKVCTITREFATAFFPEKSTTIYCYRGFEVYRSSLEGSFQKSLYRKRRGASPKTRSARIDQNTSGF